MPDEVHIELGLGAVMVKRKDGGPIRFPINGAKRHAVHLHVAAKADNMILPAESDGEYAAMLLLDVSLWVVSYMAQPHRLEFSMGDRRRKAKYTPDFELLVPQSFVGELEKETPFARAALKLPPARAARDNLVTVILEFKGRKDVRANKEEYKNKLKEAERIYTRHGSYFFVLEEVPHLTCLDHSHLQSIEMDQSSQLSTDLIDVAWEHLQRCKGVTSFCAMIDALGGGALGREAVHWLHMKGVIWVDLSRNPHPTTAVAMPPMIRGRQLPTVPTSTASQ